MANSSNPAPIAIFVYNRPEHTRKMLEALSSNKLISKSEIYFFSDGPRNNVPEDEDNIEKTRIVITEFKSADKKNIIESRENKGLAESIIDGINTVFESHDRIIVLEDDIIVSEGFLYFMNAALTQYENEERVMHVSAYMPPLSKELTELTLIQQMQCWGWGTWKSAWKYFNPSANELLNEFDSKKKKTFDYSNSYNFYRMLKNNAKGKNNSWAIRWYASIFLKNGLCLNPTRSLTYNIGHDGSGTHSYKSKSHTPEIIREIEVQKIPIEENQEVRKAIISYNWKLKFYEIVPYIKYRLLGK